MNLFSKKWYVFALLTVLPLLSIAQKPKQESLPYQTWSFPEVKTTFSTVGIIIDESELPVTLLSDPLDNEAGVVVTSSGRIPPHAIEKLNFRTYELVPIEQADMLLRLAQVPTKFQTFSDAIPGNACEPPVGFTGGLDYLFGMTANLSDSEGNILYDETFKGRTTLISSDGFASSQEARAAMKQEMWENLPNLIDNGDLARLDAITHEYIPQIMQALDYQRVSEKLYLYGFNSKKDVQLEAVNASIDEIKKVAALEDTDGYDTRLEDVLTFKIKQWNDLASGYDASDKKQKKILWGLLANVCAAQYAIGDYTGALDTSTKIAEISYRNDYTYLREMPEKRLVLLEELSKDTSLPQKNYRKIDFSASNDHKNVRFENARGLVSDGNASRDMARERKAELLFNLLALDAYYSEFEVLLRKFAEQDRKSWVGYASVNPYLLGLVKKMKRQAEGLKGADLSAFDMDDKVLVTELRDDLIWQFDDLNRELGLEEIANIEDFERADFSSKISAYILILGENIAKGRKEGIERDMATLLGRTLMTYNEELKKLPLMEMLIDELTSEGNLSYEQDAELYEKLFKRYKKHYASLIFNASEFTRYMHHTEKSRFDNLLREYYQPLYKAKAEEINSGFKDYADPKRAIDVLYLLQKPMENVQASSKR